MSNGKLLLSFVNFIFALKLCKLTLNGFSFMGFLKIVTVNYINWGNIELIDTPDQIKCQLKNPKLINLTLPQKVTSVHFLFIKDNLLHYVLVILRSISLLGNEARNPREIFPLWRSLSFNKLSINNAASSVISANDFCCKDFLGIMFPDLLL